MTAVWKPGPLLAGDVGGTKTILAAVQPAERGYTIVAQARYENAEYDTLDAVIGQFIADCPLPFSEASLSVAGPVIDGRALLTNLGWQVDAAGLGRTYGFAAVHLLNDLQATAYATVGMAPDHLATLQDGTAALGPLRAVIAPGTGLGEAFLIAGHAQVDAWPSEGGHADFAPANATQAALLAFLRDRLGHVSYEHVCSGLGIANIYWFLKESGTEEEPSWLADRLAAADDPTPVIAEAALERDGACAICRRTMEIFVDILGAETGNLALRLLPTGGVYVGGGVPPRILPLLETGRFLDAFRGKGRFAPLMRTFPVHVILEPRAALFGAADYACARRA